LTNICPFDFEQEKDEISFTVLKDCADSCVENDLGGGWNDSQFFRNSGENR
jgi:hypothetical protein